MVRIRWQTAFPAAAAVVVVLCTAAVLVIPPAVEPLSRFVALDGSAREYHALLVFQLDDCDSTLEFARLFERPVIARRVAVTSMFVGRAPELAEARRRMRARGYELPLAMASPGFLRSSRVLGHGSTPFLVIVDRSGRVRYSSTSPRTPEEFLKTADVLARLSRDW